MKKFPLFLLCVLLLTGCTATEQHPRITEDIPLFILEAISQAVNKPIEELQDKDLLDVEKLYLNGGHFTEEQKTSVYDLSIIKEMKNLKTLDITNIKVRDLNFLTNMSQLEVLYMAWDDLGDAVQDLSVVGELKNLKDLRINTWMVKDPDDNEFKIKDLSFLSQLDQLEKLVISYIDTNQYPSLEHMKNLKYLALNYSNLSDLGFLKNVTSLLDLSLSHNQISSISELSSLKNLEFLSIGSNPIKEIEVVKLLPNLQRLELDYTWVDNLAPLEQLQKLKYLDIRGSKVTSIEPLVGLNQLEILLLNPKNIQDLHLISGNVRVSEKSIVDW